MNIHPPTAGETAGEIAVAVAAAGPDATEVTHARRMLWCSTALVRSMMAGVLLIGLGIVFNASRSLKATTPGDHAEVMNTNETLILVLVLAIAALCITMVIVAAHATGWDSTMDSAKKVRQRAGA